MFLIQFAYSAVEKVYSNEDVLHTLIKEITYLETNPVTLQLNGQPVEVYFLFGGLRGDNLGLNSMLDYSKSFSANHCCRICNIDQSEMKISTRDDELLYRTKESYEAALENDSFADSGIHRNSVFNTIPGLHITDLKTVDSMHDYYEGFAHDAVIECLDYFIENQFFTLKDLNDHVKYFDYDCNESKNKPEPIKDISSSKLRMTGGQMKCFLENLPMMIGHKVPDCEQWRFLIGAIKIGFWIMKPAYTREDIECLRNLITENLDEYIRLFDTSLKPKAHFLTHYHLAITWNGPTKYTNTFIPEMNHKTFKQFASRIANRQNIAYSLAYKDQLSMAHALNENKSNLGRPFLEIGKGFFTQLSSIPIDHTLISVNNNDIAIEIINHVMLGSAKIKHTSILIEFCNDKYIFNEIKYIIRHQDAIIFICDQYKHADYDQHIDGYIVDTNNHITVRKNPSDISFYPNRLHTLPDGRKAIRIRN